MPNSIWWSQAVERPKWTWTQAENTKPIQKHKVCSQKPLDWLWFQNLALFVKTLKSTSGKSSAGNRHTTPQPKFCDTCFIWNLLYLPFELPFMSLYSELIFGFRFFRRKCTSRLLHCNFLSHMAIKWPFLLALQRSDGLCWMWEVPSLGKATGSWSWNCIENSFLRWQSGTGGQELLNYIDFKFVVLNWAVSYEQLTVKMGRD